MNTHNGNDLFEIRLYFVVFLQEKKNRPVKKNHEFLMMNNLLIS